MSAFCFGIDSSAAFVCNGNHAGLVFWCPTVEYSEGNLTFFLSRHADQHPWFSSSRLGTNARRLPPAELHSQRGGSLGGICVSRQEPGNEADFFFRDAANHRTAERRKLGQRDPFNRPPSILLRLLRGHLWRRSLVLWSQPTASP